MKKTYQKPTCDVILLHTHQHLLAGSGKATETSMGFGEEAGNEDVAGSRSFDFWGDEE